MTNAAEAEQAGLKVLVIDDSNTIRRSAEIFLKQGGYEVLLAEDGFDALSKVNDHDPDLIFCGRMIAYNWFDCDKQPQPRVINALAGCQDQPDQQVQ